MYIYIKKAKIRKIFESLCIQLRFILNNITKRMKKLTSNQAYFNDFKLLLTRRICNYNNNNNDRINRFLCIKTKKIYLYKNEI